MKFSIITANRNGERFLEESIQSVVSQEAEDIELEYIVVDGASNDGSLEIIDRYRSQISIFISEPDDGPVNAINKGLKLATGDIVGWLNTDDRYHPGALKRVAEAFKAEPNKALCFGRCNIIDEQGMEIRRWITRFKEFFFPISSRFTVQCLNFVSQPTLFLTRQALKVTGFLREDLVAAWDYDFILRLWKNGGAICLRDRMPVADFRWHEASISGSNYTIQFKEELEATKEHAGTLAPQTLIHYGVRWGIVGVYALMAALRNLGTPNKEP
jgi:glycosyltransferase involved in cell wall biosynthesis